MAAWRGTAASSTCEALALLEAVRVVGALDSAVDLRKQLALATDAYKRLQASFDCSRGEYTAAPSAGRRYARARHCPSVRARVGAG